MALLLLQLHKLNQKQFTRRNKQLYSLDPILGPQAVAWGLQKWEKWRQQEKEEDFTSRKLTRLWMMQPS